MGKIVLKAGNSVLNIGVFTMPLGTVSTLVQRTDKRSVCARVQS